MTTTWSPQSTCGVKLGLCLPRRILAIIVATRPTTSPSASIKCHFFSTSAGLADLVVFISAFMAFDLLYGYERRHLMGAPMAGLIAAECRKVKRNRAFRNGYYTTAPTSS